MLLSWCLFANLPINHRSHSHRYAPSS